jgi:hypothetical protein
MIAVMVLAIGLVGVGALVSVGALQAQRANIDDRKVILGQAEVRDDKVRGFLHAETWLTPSGAQYMVAPTSTSGLSGLAFPVPSATAAMPYNLQPVCIDPMMVGKWGSAIGPFAQANAQLAMQRLTVGTYLPNGAFSTLSVAAGQACLSEDDMSFTPATAADALPTGRYNAVGTKREFDGHYSWLATLVPVYGDLQATETRNLMNMSVVVFNQRQFGVAPVSSTPVPTDSERACQVTTVVGSGYGGGDLTLSDLYQSDATGAGLALRVGECLMLGWMQVDVPADSNGNPTTFSPSATYGTVPQKPTPARPMFRWYRILNAGPTTGSGGNFTRNITVAGADLNTKIIVPGSMYAFIYDGAVAVYERTVRLEGPSMWTN